MSGSGISVLEVQPPELDLDAVAARMASHQARIAELLRRYPVKRAALLQVLWLVQEEFGWVPRIAIKWAASICAVSPVHAFAVVEFYTMYQQIPAARFHIRVCHNVSCHIQGAEALIAHLEQSLGISAGAQTADGLFALDRVECLAACGNGPAVQINDDFLFGPGEELNRHEEGWRPRAADLDRLIARLRERAAADPQARPVDQLGGILLDSAGHPGAEGAAAQGNPRDYAPPPPALNPAVSSQGSAITITALCAPEVRLACCERSQDGSQWQQIACLDPTTIPGPPGPKTVSFSDQLAIGEEAHYRITAESDGRRSRPSAVVTILADAAPVSDEEGAS